MVKSLILFISVIILFFIFFSPYALLLSIFYHII
nr:MAG TPA: hypothetical protein [Caudoviricetes sp.]DAW32504.1 MAG TPA: hypothetical protein [Caudoviricetes sp.]